VRLLALKHLLVLCGIFGGFYFLARGMTADGPFSYDEADYMYAASLGWTANWMDSPALSLPEFLRAGLRGRARSERNNLSELIRSTNDVLFYRHWHGPLYADWLGLLRRFGLDERSTRAAGVVFPLAATILLYFGALCLLPGRAGEIAGILASVLYIWSVPVLRTTELAPHQFFAVTTIVALLLLAKTLQGPPSARLHWYGALIATGLSFGLLEVALALVLTVLICGHLGRDRLRPDFAFAGKSLGALLSPVLIFWPTAIFKLSFIKAYLFMAYLAVFRRGAWGSTISTGQTWWLRFANSPVTWILFAFAVGFFVRSRAKAPLLIPFATFSIAMFLVIVPVNSATPRYILPLLPGVVLLGAFATGIVAARTSPVLRSGAVVVICAAMFVTSWLNVQISRPAPDRRSEALLAFVRNPSVSPRTLLIPHDDLPTLHYYFPNSRFKTYYDEAEIPDQIRSGGIDGVIYHDRAGSGVTCSAEEPPDPKAGPWKAVCP